MSDLENLGEIVNDFIQEASEITEDLAEKFVELDKNRDKKELLNEIFRSMHTLKGSSGFLGFTDIGVVAHRAEDILNKIRKGEALISSPTIDVMLEAVDIISRQVVQLKNNEKLSVPITEIVGKLTKVFETLPKSAAEVEKLDNEHAGKGVPSQPKVNLEMEVGSTVPEQEIAVVGEEIEESTNEIFEGEMKEIIEDFIVETAEILEKIDNQFVVLEENPEDLDLLNEIFRYVHTIKGTGSFLGFNQLTSLTHVAEDLLNLLRKGERKISDEVMDSLLEFVDMLKLLLGDINNKNLVVRNINIPKANLKRFIDGETAAPKLVEKEVKVIAKPKAPKVQQTVQQTPKVTIEQTEEKVEEAPKEAEPVQEEAPPATGVDTEVRKRAFDQTIRVDVKRLEDLLNMVGELVLGRNRLQQATDNLIASQDDSPLLDELNRVNSEIALITKGIQEGVMKTRMVAIGKVFNKFPRMIRDLSRQTGKSIELIVNGAETELDKTLVEEISDPLVHLIRNSADHGIESVEERVKAGKTEKGKITLFADQEGDNIVIGVQDDGKGIDSQIIAKKAIEKGLTTEAEVERMTEREIFSFIFAPGFSTAAKVTNVSGRGVGMDVVKTNIQKLNGYIEIDSQVGKGTLILIKLPLTLAIITGLMVKVASEYFAIPISSVRGINSIEDGQLQTINKMEVFKLRDEVIPLIRMSDIFNLPETEYDDHHGKDRFVVIVAAAEKRYGFIVDSVNEGQAEIVIKQLGKFMPHIPGIAGGTIMGDGRVRLIVDVQEMITMAAKARDKYVIGNLNKI